MRLIYNELKNLLILIAFINLLVSCSSTRIVYSLAEEFFFNEINYYLNVDKNDKIFLDKQISEMIDWHRTSMLPRYSIYLRYQNPQSIEHMKQKMQKRRDKRIKQLSESEEILFEKRLDKLILNFERFLGSLTDAQLNLLKDHSYLTLNDSMIRLHNRTQRQKLFIDFLENKPTEQELKVYLDKLLLQDPSITDTAQLAFSLDRFQKLEVGILSISTSSQRETIVKK